MSKAEDKIDALAVALDQVDIHIRVVDRVAKRSERNRLSMLHLHATAAVLIGILFSLLESTAMSGPNWTIVRIIPGAPVSLGMMLFIGGAILGPATWFRRLSWEKVGLWMILVWYTAIALSFGLGMVLWFAGVNPSRTAPALFVPVVYFHLASIMSVHLVTLSRMTRLRRAAQ